MILLSFSGSKTVPVIFLVCQEAGVILTTITCNPILWTLLCAIYIYIYIFFFTKGKFIGIKHCSGIVSWRFPSSVL